MSRPLPVPSLSFEEYLEPERNAEFRHGHVAGEIHAMAGGSKHHNRIALNTDGRLITKLEHKACETYAENVLLKVDSGHDRSGYYPDVMTVCDPADQPEDLFVEKPSLIVEVPSDSTRHSGRNPKLHDYTRLHSFSIYLLGSQRAAHITRHRRENGWKPEILTRADDEIPIDCVPGISTMLTVAGVDRGLDFPA